jgi:diadenosine tetraphosphatase ApaH/serine/threonine PP2A family protein phosphatase
VHAWPAPPDGCSATAGSSEPIARLQRQPGRRTALSSAPTSRRPTASVMPFVRRLWTIRPWYQMYARCGASATALGCRLWCEGRAASLNHPSRASQSRAARGECRCTTARWACAGFWRSEGYSRRLRGALPEDLGWGRGPVRAPVERVQLHVGDVQLLGDASRQCRLPGAGRAYDRDAPVAFGGKSTAGDWIIVAAGHCDQCCSSRMFPSGSVR